MRQLGLERLGRQSADLRAAAVGEDYVERFYVVNRLAVDDRACACRVIGDHPADRGPVGGGQIQGQVQAMGFQQFVQFVEDDSRFDRDRCGRGVQVQHSVHIAGEIQ